MSNTNTDVDISKHARDIAEGVDADVNDIEEGLRNLLEYSVPLEEAKRTLRRRYGAETPSESEVSETKKVEDITLEDTNITVEVLVLNVGKRSIFSGGEEQIIYEGEVADDTGKIQFTAWNDFGLEPGKSVRIEGVSVREWAGEPQLNIGSNASVSEIEGVETEHEPRGSSKLADLVDGDRGVELDVKVIEAESRVINARDGETSITSGILADDSGRLPFTDWENHDLSEGDSIHIENAYINEYRGVPQVNIGEFTTIEPIEEIDISHTAPETQIGKAIEKGGAFDVVVEGNIIEVKDGSGIIQRCPECGRVIQKGQCRSHGEVDGITDMRTKAVLDDGTGALTLVLDRDLTEKVYGGTLEDAEEEAREAMDQGVVMDKIRERVVGRAWRVRGNISVGEYGANMEATELEESSRDVVKLAREVLNEHE